MSTSKNLFSLLVTLLILILVSCVSPSTSQTAATTNSSSVPAVPSLSNSSTTEVTTSTTTTETNTTTTSSSSFTTTNTTLPPPTPSPAIPLRRNNLLDLVLLISAGFAFFSPHVIEAAFIVSRHAATSRSIIPDGFIRNLATNTTCGSWFRHDPPLFFEAPVLNWELPPDEPDSCSAMLMGVLTGNVLISLGVSLIAYFSYFFYQLCKYGTTPRTLLHPCSNGWLARSFLIIFCGFLMPPICQVIMSAAARCGNGIGGAIAAVVVLLTVVLLYLVIYKRERNEVYRFRKLTLKSAKKTLGGETWKLWLIYFFESRGIWRWKGDEKERYALERAILKYKKKKKQEKKKKSKEEIEAADAEEKKHENDDEDDDDFLEDEDQQQEGKDELEMKKKKKKSKKNVELSISSARDKAKERARRELFTINEHGVENNNNTSKNNQGKKSGQEEGGENNINQDSSSSSSSSSPATAAAGSSSSSSGANYSSSSLPRKQTNLDELASNVSIDDDEELHQLVVQKIAEIRHREEKEEQETIKAKVLFSPEVDSDDDAFGDHHHHLHNHNTSSETVPPPPDETLFHQLKLKEGFKKDEEHQQQKGYSEDTKQRIMSSFGRSNLNAVLEQKRKKELAALKKQQQQLQQQQQASANNSAPSPSHSASSATAAASGSPSSSFVPNSAPTFHNNNNNTSPSVENEQNNNNNVEASPSSSSTQQQQQQPQKKRPRPPKIDFTLTYGVSAVSATSLPNLHQLVQEHEKKEIRKKNKKENNVSSSSSSPASIQEPLASSPSKADLRPASPEQIRALKKIEREEDPQAKSDKLRYLRFLLALPGIEPYATSSNWNMLFLEVGIRVFMVIAAVASDATARLLFSSSSSFSPSEAFSIPCYVMRGSYLLSALVLLLVAFFRAPYSSRLVFYAVIISSGFEVMSLGLLIADDHIGAEVAPPLLMASLVVSVILLCFASQVYILIAPRVWPDLEFAEFDFDPEKPPPPPQNSNSADDGEGNNNNNNNKDATGADGDEANLSEEEKKKRKQQQQEEQEADSRSGRSLAALRQEQEMQDFRAAAALGFVDSDDDANNDDQQELMLERRAVTVSRGAGGRRLKSPQQEAEDDFTKLDRRIRETFHDFFHEEESLVEKHEAFLAAHRDFDQMLVEL